jgi:hypothetical protein
MGKDEVQAPISGDLVDDVAGWASLWGDLLLVEMTLHTRSLMPDDATNLFGRRALWEAAVTAYWRTANSGRRQQQRVTELLSVLGRSAEECHQEIERWRNQHVAHRVDELRESVDVRLVIDEQDGTPRRVNIQVSPVLGPEEENSDLAERFSAHVTALKNLVWEDRIHPLEGRILKEHADRGDEMLQASKAGAQPTSHFAITIHPSGEASG